MASPSLQRKPQLYQCLLHILGLTSFTQSFRYLFSLSTKITLSFGGPFQQLTNLCKNLT